MKKYWTTKEVYGHFGKSRETIRRWRDGRGFPEPVYLGGHERGPASYVIEEVLAWETKCLHERKARRPAALNETEGVQPATAD